MKNNEMTLPELFSAAFKHKDMPSDLKVDLWNWLNNRSDIDFDSPEYLALMIGAETGAADTPRQSETKIKNTALLISGLLNNPNVPQKIHDALDNALCDTDGVDTTEINAFWKSPEYVAMVLRGMETTE